MSAATPDGSTATPPETAKPKVGALTMQIIIRRDLLDVEKWPVGPLIAQGSHAATAIMHLQRENPAMKDYTADWKHMRKAILQTPNEETIRSLSNALANATPPIEHHLWIEEPENIPTALAILPNRREKRLKKILDAHQATSPVIRFRSKELKVSGIAASDLATSFSSNGDQGPRGCDKPQDVEDRSDL